MVASPSSKVYVILPSVVLAGGSGRRGTAFLGLGSAGIGPTSILGICGMVAIGTPSTEPLSAGICAAVACGLPFSSAGLPCAALPAGLTAAWVLDGE